MSVEGVPRLRVLGIPVDPIDATRAARLVARHLADGTPIQVVTINAEMAMNTRADPALAAVIGQAGLVLPDGSGVVWAARRRGARVRKLPGVEFIHEICAACARAGRPLYLLGAAPGVAQAAAEVLAARHKGLEIGGVRDGYFKPEEEDAVLEAIREARPGALLVALGVPRQEFWIARHQAALEVPVAMGVGGSFDVLSGRLRRAPGWMRALHLEWLYRLIQEPWRWKRMLTALPTFAILALASEKQERYTGYGMVAAASGQQPGEQGGLPL
ncbi:MAG: WecB/TagA/CpsF family glycosyltransferase [Candidatus Sericytochromatia bacterium]|nr:WecB/TagA/CpsF family glycosyltransferase [Candidatus Tanganyikabacteria bacterium]